MGFEIFQNSNNIKNNPMNNQGKTTPVAQNIQQNSVFEKKPPKIAVIDNYGDKSLNIDPYDDIPDISHGEAVESYIKAQCSGAIIEKKGNFTPATEKENRRGASPTIALKEVSDSINKGERYDAVNFSVEAPAKIEDLAKATGFPLTRENLAQYADKIRNLFKSDNSQENKEFKEQFESIEKITEKGVPFYVAAGNSGNNQVNLYSFAKGVKIVGALDKNEKNKAEYSADNSMVNRWEKGDYPINKVKDINGNLTGYDINGDNKSDVLAKNTSGKQKSIFDSGSPNSMNGTSFSTPAALGKDLRAKFGNVCGQ